MAESFLFSIAESLISKLASRAYEEASQVLGVYDTLQVLKQTLSYIKAVLLDAEQKQEQNHELKEWLRQIKHVFYDAENVFDEFECETLRKKVVKTHGSAKAKVSHFFSSSNPLVFRYKMANQIKEINKRLDKVAADRHKFGLQIIEVDRRVVHGREMTYSSVNNSDVIGRDLDREKIIEILIHQNANIEDKNLSVIPIVGIGGLGKTTLAKFVFNDKRIQEHFAPKMWVCVSDDFEIKQLLIKIINSANESVSNGDPIHQQNLKDLDIQQLQNYLKDKLAGQKFLLVLDDVWNEDRVKWVELRDLIQVGAEGSKILVTTRSHSIASMMGTIPSHSLEGLSLDDSLSLFIKWAFKEGEENKYPHLVNIGRDIVKKCGGVPLAVRTLGSLLFSKFDAVEWVNVRDNEIWNLPQKKDDILPALKLSYDHMPSYLRQCFAFFSLYPKDYQFGNLEITSLWRANGLLSSSKMNGTPEDVAIKYLHELQSRSFLQNCVNLSTFYFFEIHDLVHDLALFVAKDECLHINSYNQNIPENAQHLYFEENVLLGHFSTSKSMGVRTVRFLGVEDAVLLDTWLSKYKYLRYLNLIASTFETLPRSIGKLKHLRYFNISNNQNLKRLPDSICKLQNLEDLMLDGCTTFETLPKGLRKLISLRKLGITTKQCFFYDDEIAELSSLEYLCVDSCQNLESMLQGVKLPTLKTFEINGCPRLKNFQLDVKCFPELETLLIGDCKDLNFLSKGHDEQGRKLKLKSVMFFHLEQLVTLPQWVQEASQTLHSLSIAECNHLEMLPEWLSTLTNLKILHIIKCPKLLVLPNNIHHLIALERLMIEDCPELYKKYQPQVGKYWPQISHIKYVTIKSTEEED